MTRENIIDAAIRLFLKDGVSRTTLEKIATEAGYTRGAVYHHFENKAKLLHELHVLIKPPAEELMSSIDNSVGDDPLTVLRNDIADSLSGMMADPHNRDIHAIFLHNCEFVDRINPMVESECRNADCIREMFMAHLGKAVAEGKMRKDVCVETAANALLCFCYGMISLTTRHVLTGDEPPLKDYGKALDIFLDGLRVKAP